VGSLLRAGHTGVEQQQACQRESCDCHPAILRTRAGCAKSSPRSVILIPACASEYAKEFLCVLA
jgi:hypothetical protein